jgi:hypothetical protein
MVSQVSIEHYNNYLVNCVKSLDYGQKNKEHLRKFILVKISFAFVLFKFHLKITVGRRVTVQVIKDIFPSLIISF